MSGILNPWPKFCMVFRKPSFIGINISDYVVFRKNAEEKQWQWKKENRSRKRQSITAVYCLVFPDESL